MYYYKKNYFLISKIVAVLCVYKRGVVRLWRHYQHF